MAAQADLKSEKASASSELLAKLILEGGKFSITQQPAKHVTVIKNIMGCI
jgi:hypothetical protein